MGTIPVHRYGDYTCASIWGLYLCIDMGTIPVHRYGHYTCASIWALYLCIDMGTILVHRYGDYTCASIWGLYLWIDMGTISVHRYGDYTCHLCIDMGTILVHRYGDYTCASIWGLYLCIDMGTILVHRYGDYTCASIWGLYLWIDMGTIPVHRYGDYTCHLCIDMGTILVHRYGDYTCASIWGLCLCIDMETITVHRYGDYTCASIWGLYLCIEMGTIPVHQYGDYTCASPVAWLLKFVDWIKNRSLQKNVDKAPEVQKRICQDDIERAKKRVAATVQRKTYPDEQDAVFDEVDCLFLDKSFCPFLYKNGNVRIITGEEEAVFGWITLNFLKGTFSSSNSIGALELGGASTQNTFRVSDKGTGQPMLTVKLAGKTYPLYAHSYLGYGAKEATDSYLKSLADHQPIGTRVLTNPCHNSHYTHEDRE
ncbi:hypothetical protein QZH41_017224 [Actinostola sp. cb2023]|nr:hypothetical protein QZH41_017224 [Actinostola sp. cb2023]